MSDPGLPKFTTPVSIAAITIESLPIDIVAQTVGNIGIDIKAQTLGTLSIDIAAQSLSQVDVNIKASAVTINVDVQNAYLYVRTEAAQNLNVDIKAQTIGNISIDIAAQTMGNVSVNLAASAITLDINIKAQTANVEVDIKAQTVDLNIKTSGGANIVIDKLTQAAYLERRSTLSNNGAQFAETSPTGNTRNGKLFPRGCRGWIDDVEAYCRDSGAAGGTITVYLAPFIGAGYLYSATITVPAEGTYAWRAASFDVMWTYDSLFIFFVCSSSDLKVGTDLGTPPDQWSSTDAGVTWTNISARTHLRVLMHAQTIGDIPVSGTINNIAIPNAAGRRGFVAASLPLGTETTIDTIAGMGYCEFFRFEVSHDDIVVRAYVDGSEAFRVSAHNLSLYGYTVSTPGIQLLTFAEADACYVQVLVRLEFRRELKFTGDNPEAIDHAITFESVPNLIQ